MQRFSELEQRLTAAAQAAPRVAPTTTAAAPQLPTEASLPPPPPLPLASARSQPVGAMPPGAPPFPGQSGQLSPLYPAPMPALTRVTVTDRQGASAPHGSQAPASDTRSISTFLPVSFTRGTLLGGLDAPTGGQAQSNPHPVLIRLSDNSVLPNRFRGEYRDCFVVAAGYGDISSERAYLRTQERLSVRR